MLLSDPVHNPEKHDPEWAQSRMDAIPMGAILNGRHPEWTPSQMDTIPNGHHPEWTAIPNGPPFQMDTIPNEHLQLYSYFGVL